MKTLMFAVLLSCLLLVATGCELPRIIRPLRLYDLESGNTIEVFCKPTSHNHGRIVSSRDETEQYDGEYVLDQNFTGFPDYSKSGTVDFNAWKDKPPAEWAELYGFGKNSNAKPVGTGIIVGKDGTVIEIVFYKISKTADGFQTGDGVGKDNKGRYYRIFLSTEEL